MWKLSVLLVFCLMKSVYLTKNKYSVEYLLNNVFPHRISSDIDSDPCKADGFYGDIALPNINYEIEYSLQKLNKTFQDEINKYKKEIELEGLQVEEEGLLAIYKQREKHDEFLKKDEDYKPDEDHKLRHRKIPEDINETGKSEMIKILKTKEDRRKYVALRSDAKPKFVDDDFDQIEPKYFPHIHEESKELKENIGENRNQRIQNERARRLHHMGAASVFEEKKKSDEKEIQKESFWKSLDEIKVDMITEDKLKDEGLKQNDTLLTEDILKQINEEESERKKKKENKIQNKRKSRRRNDKRINLDIGEKNGRLRHRNKDGRRNNKKNEGRRKKNTERIFPTPTVTPDITGSFHRRITRAATARKERIWEHGVIPYKIDNNFSGPHKALFKQAMRHWENFTCVKFVEKTSPDEHEHPDYVLFTERPCGCCSFVGKRGNGAQAISIGKNCDKFGIVVHELGHVVGFWHEHTRPDRDNHVQIVRENIMQGQEYNFNKLNEDEVNSLGLAYDYESIMHYARNTFSKGTYLDTIQPIDKGGGYHKRLEIGQRIKLSDGDIAQTNLLYNCPKCGRTFQDNTATFSAPLPINTSSPYTGEHCEWRITSTHGEKIILTFQEMDILESDGCKTDYVEIRDGYWQQSPSLGRFCGKDSVKDLIISTNGFRMLITYVTTSKGINYRGFTATYEAVCGGDLSLNENSGQIESPNYPEDYLANKECIWKLKAYDNFQIVLKFQTFEVENHDNCQYDYVEIRDGHDLDSPLLGKFCGYKLPPDILSTGTNLMVKFVSDGTVQKAGFSATYMQEFDECNSNLVDPGCEHECVNTLGGYECTCRIGFELHSDMKKCEDACGGVLTTLNGTITSPYFPELYPEDKKCVWEIVVPTEYKITLNFTHFDIEGNSYFFQECEYDKVIVSSKLEDDTLKRHGAYCGRRKPPLITSEANALRIEFSSDITVQKSGFAAVYFTDKDECAHNNGGCYHECQNTIGSYVCYCHNGFTLHENGHDCKENGCKYDVKAPFGDIVSPNFPDYYPSKKDCVWLFTTTPGHRIKLVFTEFELEPHQECAYDHVVLYDGNTTEAHTLGRFCGSKIPYPISATGIQMLMVFKSDSSVQRKGFKAIHSTACGGHLQATSQVKHFYSHSGFGDHDYDNRADCDWSIEAAPGRNVHLTFLTFELEDEQDCGYDFVEIYNGLDASGTSYGRFCGDSIPSDIFSMAEALVVRFRTDTTMVRKGFAAAYVATDPMGSEEFSEKLLRDQENED